MESFRTYNFSSFKEVGVDFFLDKTARIVYPQEVVIGKHVAIDMGVYISAKANIGDYIHIAPYVCIIGGEKSNIIMKEFSAIATGSKILCGSDNFNEGLTNPQVPPKYKKTIFTTVTFERFAVVGVNCVVMSNVTLAEGSIVGANSVVTKDTEPWTLYVGSPAKPIKKRKRDLIIKAYKELGYEY